MSVEKTTSLNKQTSRLLSLLDLVTNQLKDLINSIINTDLKKLSQIEGNDFNVNIEFHYIQDKSTWILTQHVFFGEELRRLLSYNSIAKEFERLGDVIASIARYLVNGNLQILAKKDLLDGLSEIVKWLNALEQSIKNPEEKVIIAHLEQIKKDVNIYKKTKLVYLKKIAVSSDINEIENYLKEVRLFIRIRRMSTFISNSYEYLIYTLTAKNFDFDSLVDTS